MLTAQNLHCCGVRTQSVRDEGIRHEALVLEKFPQQFQCGGLVAAILHEDIENLAWDCQDFRVWAGG